MHTVYTAFRRFTKITLGRSILTTFWVTRSGLFEVLPSESPFSTFSSDDLCRSRTQQFPSKHLRRVCAWTLRELTHSIIFTQTWICECCIERHHAGFALHVPDLLRQVPTGGLHTMKMTSVWEISDLCERFHFESLQTIFVELKATFLLFGGNCVSAAPKCNCWAAIRFCWEQPSVCTGCSLNANKVSAASRPLSFPIVKPNFLSSDFRLAVFFERTQNVSLSWQCGNVRGQTRTGRAPHALKWPAFALTAKPHNIALTVGTLRLPRRVAVASRALFVSCGPTVRSSTVTEMDAIYATNNMFIMPTKNSHLTNTCEQISGTFSETN